MAQDIALIIGLSSKCLLRNNNGIDVLGCMECHRWSMMLSLLYKWIGGSRPSAQIEILIATRGCTKEVTLLFEIGDANHLI